MKLYGTVTSERASKGQGGNKFLQVNIGNDKQMSLIDIEVIAHDDGTTFVSVNAYNNADGVIGDHFSFVVPKCNGRHRDMKEIADCEDCRKVLDGKE